MIERGAQRRPRPQQAFRLPPLLALAGEVITQAVDGSDDDAELVRDEVAQVGIVALRMQVGSDVCAGAFLRMLEMEMYWVSQYPDLSIDQ